MDLEKLKKDISKLDLSQNGDVTPLRDCLVILGCALNCYTGDCSVGCPSGCNVSCSNVSCINGCQTGCTSGGCVNGCSAGCYSMMSQ